MAAYSIGLGEVQVLGHIGVRQCDLDRLCKRMQSKGSTARFVYEAGPCGYALYRHLRRKGFDCMVCAIQACRGIQFTVAISLIAEIGDLSRFDHPRQLMAWLGITPSEHSSGGSRKLGGITKAGNRFARKVLVEAAGSYRYPAKVSRIIQVRHQGLPKPIVDRAWDAQVRLCGRYRRMTACGKLPKVAVVGVARELAAYIRDVARRVPAPAPDAT